MKDKLKQLAQHSAVLEELICYAERSFDKVKESPEWKQYQDDLEEVQYLKDNITELRKAVNELTLKTYEQTGDKKPVPGVGIKVYTVLKYDEKVALEYCKSNLTPAIQLDKRVFEKIAKESQFDFVEYLEEPRATIASDLSEYLD